MDFKIINHKNLTNKPISLCPHCKEKKSPSSFKDQLKMMAKMLDLAA